MLLKICKFAILAHGRGPPSGCGMLLVVGGIPPILECQDLRAFFAELIDRPPKDRPLLNFHYRRAVDPRAPGRCCCVVDCADAEALRKYDGTPWAEVLFAFEKDPSVVGTACAAELKGSIGEGPNHSNF